MLYLFAASALAFHAPSGVVSPMSRVAASPVMKGYKGFWETATPTVSTVSVASPDKIADMVCTSRLPPSNSGARAMLTSKATLVVHRTRPVSP